MISIWSTLLYCEGFSLVQEPLRMKPPTQDDLVNHAVRRFLILAPEVSAARVPAAHSLPNVRRYSTCIPARSDCISVSWQCYHPPTLLI
jgi:hypothetical protein